MNKTSKLLFGLSSLAMLAACSSEEPNGGEPQAPDTGKSTTMYLAVNITDANAMGRALEDKNEGDFAQGTLNEHTVATADFFFFDKEGIYLTQAQVWNDGNEGPAENGNVEYLGNNVLVLEGLTEKNLPKYLVTVLNAPAGLTSSMLKGVSTIDELRNKTVNSYLSGSNFIMTTSSFLGGDTNFYNDKRYYANVIPSDYLIKEPINVNNPEKKLSIYVERLAAKYSLSMPNGKSFDLKLTVAGEGNDNNDDVTVGDTGLKVTVTGFGVTTTEPTAHLSKNLDGYTNGGAVGTSWAFAAWNAAQFHRSFWGKSVNYGKTISADSFDHDKFGAYDKNTNLNPVYSLENTNTLNNITRAGSNPAEVDASLVTNFVITAVIKNADGTEITDLVKYNGIFFKNDQFTKYLLRTVQETEGLNYYKQVSSTSTENGGIVENNATYLQVDAPDFKFTKKDNGGKMTVELAYEGTLYAYDATAEEGKRFSEINNAKTEIDGKIEKTIGSNYPVRYNGGKTVYTVPVQHLLGENNQYTLTNEGEFGVVRNHWYELSLNKIGKIGQGVFDPSEGEDGDIVYPDPDPDPETYGLAASINILSWKVVQQSVDL